MRKKKGISFRIEPDILEQFRDKTRKEGVKQSEMIEILIKFYLDDKLKLIKKAEISNK